MTARFSIPDDFTPLNMPANPYLPKNLGLQKYSATQPIDSRSGQVNTGLTKYLDDSRTQNLIPVPSLMNEDMQPAIRSSASSGGMMFNQLYRLKNLGHALIDAGEPVTLTEPAGREPAFCDSPIPDGSTIRQNVQKLHAMVDGGASSASSQNPFPGEYAALGTWLASVKPGGRWAKVLGEPAGNRNYGATGRAIGLPYSVLLRGAGFAESLEPYTERSGAANAGTGNFLGGPPYGDTIEGQKQIKQGYFARCDQKKPY